MDQGKHKEEEYSKQIEELNALIQSAEENKDTKSNELEKMNEKVEVLMEEAAKYKQNFQTKLT